MFGKDKGKKKGGKEDAPPLEPANELEERIARSTTSKTLVLHALHTWLTNDNMPRGLNFIETLCAFNRSGLTTLDVSGSELVGQDLLQIFLIPHLTVLKMNRCAIPQLDVQACGASLAPRYLREMSMESCDLAEIPMWVNTLGALETLLLGNNTITGVEPLLGLMQLRKLDVRWNNISHFPKAVFQVLMNLKEVLYEGNRWLDVPSTDPTSVVQVVRACVDPVKVDLPLFREGGYVYQAMKVMAAKPALRDPQIIKLAISRYAKWQRIRLDAKYRDLLLVPPIDIRLIWWAHMLHVTSFRSQPTPHPNHAGTYFEYKQYNGQNGSRTPGHSGKYACIANQKYKLDDQLARVWKIEVGQTFIPCVVEHLQDMHKRYMTVPDAPETLPDLVAGVKNFFTVVDGIIANPYLGEEQFAHLAFLRYQRFLALFTSDDGLSSTLAPPEDIELMWITHMLYHKEYVSNCFRAAGRIVDHHIRLGPEQLSTVTTATEGAWKSAFRMPYRIDYALLARQRGSSQRLATRQAEWEASESSTTTTTQHGAYTERAFAPVHPPAVERQAPEQELYAGRGGDDAWWKPTKDAGDTTTVIPAVG